MFCRKCGAQLPQDSVFCHKCGLHVTGIKSIPADAAAVNTQNTPPDAAGTRNQPDKPTSPPVTAEPYAPYAPAIYAPKKTGKKIKIVVISALCCVVAAAAVVAISLVLAENDRAGRYTQAINYLDSGHAKRAMEAFEELGKYKSSQALADEARQMLDYQEAKAKMDTGDYEEAKKAFDALGDYKDATPLAARCQKNIDYDAAKKLLYKKEYEHAMAMFNALGDYEDAADLAANCQKEIIAAQNAKDYAAAEEAFQDDRFYTACGMFTKLGDYHDSAKRAKACKQAYPFGEIYRNEDFTKKGCPLTIKLPKESQEPDLVKIFTPKDVLVCAVFLTPGKSVRINLPAGSYKMKSAIGKDWFGMKELFGDEGYYDIMIFEKNSEVITLKSSKIYTLTLRYAKNSNIGSKQIPRTDF